MKEELNKIKEIEENTFINKHCTEIHNMRFLKLEKGVRLIWMALLCIIVVSLFGCSNSEFISYDPSSDCVPTQLETGILFQCKDGSEYELKNGEDGIDGISSITEIIPLCPDLNGTHKEVVLNIEGSLVAYFAKNSDARKSRLTLLEEGTIYTTTDANNNVCKFTILNGEVIYE